MMIRISLEKPRIAMLKIQRLKNSIQIFTNSCYLCMLCLVWSRGVRRAFHKENRSNVLDPEQELV